MLRPVRGEQVRDNGQLVMVNSELYIEAGNPGWPQTEGVEFLHEKPQTDEDHEKFSNYIHRMEKLYEADFVYGKQADALLIEVKEALNTIIKTETKYWDKNVGFGMKL